MPYSYANKQMTTNSQNAQVARNYLKNCGFTHN